MGEGERQRGGGGGGEEGSGEGKDNLHTNDTKSGIFDSQRSVTRHRLESVTEAPGQNTSLKNKIFFNLNVTPPPPPPPSSLTCVRVRWKHCVRVSSLLPCCTHSFARFHLLLSIRQAFLCAGQQSCFTTNLKIIIITNDTKARR